MSGPYDDLYDRPRHISKKHPQMAAADRAAQFSPFAALTGFGAVIRETGRRTEERVELDECEKAVLNERLVAVKARLGARPMATVTYFRPDEKKNGGAHVTVTGAVKKIDAYERAVVMESGERIPIDDIVAICEGEETQQSGETATRQS